MELYDKFLTQNALDFYEDFLAHYGMPRRSGRYPWGSGENPYQHNQDFLSRVDELRKEGFSFTDENGEVWKGDTAIAKSMGISTTQFRAHYSLANDERRASLVETAEGLRKKGYSLNEIAEKMGYANNSSVRALLDPNAKARTNKARATADILKAEIDKKGMIDVGKGVERELGCSKEKLAEALYILNAEGYPTYSGRVEQVTNPGKFTTVTVAAPPGTEHKEMYRFDKVHTVRDYVSHDNGETYQPRFVYPKSMDSSRLKIRYAEEGGLEKDGVIELRRGVDDLSLGESHYAQVRILVDNDRYLKGMAIYSDHMPDGVDVVFNTNKKAGTPMRDVLKKISDDPTNPFKSLIIDGVDDPDRPEEHGGGQSYYYDQNGEKQLSLINKRAQEGSWGDWADHLSAQFLSKQNQALIDERLKFTIADKRQEYDEICELTNPTVKKVLLKSFSDDCDAAAVHLKAAALPRQKYQVILPLTDIKDNEVYAPNYENGETVALIRYPHGGTFEIPILKVNNKNKEGRAVLGNTPADAIGINAKVAARLSGADFDGDTVMVIPCNSSRSKVRITAEAPLRALENFDPGMEYGADSCRVDTDGIEHWYRGDREIRIMRNTQKEMGTISNLITDMTLKGATNEELSRAVKHSMVVIDAEKHHYDYKDSEQRNGIAALKKKYQAHDDGVGYGGASTLISRAKSETSVPKRRGSAQIDPETGKQSYKLSGETYVDRKGNTQPRMQASTKMAETDDAFTLVSDFNTPAERAYAKYANSMKSLGNQARKEMLATGKIEYSASAKQTYQKEVDSLDAKLNVALKNAPRERKAQMIANTVVKEKEKNYYQMGMSRQEVKKELKKDSQRALTAARNEVGAKSHRIEISDREWEAIQSGAISENQLLQILNHADIDKVRERATPRSSTVLSDAKIARIRAYALSGYTTAEIAKALGVSASSVTKYLK